MISVRQPMVQSFMQLFADNANEKAKIKQLPWKTHRAACLSTQDKELRNQIDGMYLSPYVSSSRVMKYSI